MESKLSKWGKFLHNSLSQVNKPYLMIGAIALLLIFNGSHLVESYKILTGAKYFKDYWHVGLAAACLEASVFFATYKNSKEYVLIGFFTAILCNLFSVFHSFEQKNTLSGWEYYLPYFVGFVISSAFAYMPVFFSEHLATSIREEIELNERKISENTRLNQLIEDYKNISSNNENLSKEVALAAKKNEKISILEGQLSSKESELITKDKELKELQSKLSILQSELSSEKENNKKLIKRNEFLESGNKELSSYENLKIEKLQIESELREMEKKASEWKSKFLKLNESVSNFEKLKQKAQELETKLSILQAKESEFNSIQMQDFDNFIATSTKIYNALQNYKNAKNKGTESLIQEKQSVLENLRQTIFVKKQ